MTAEEAPVVVVDRIDEGWAVLEVASGRATVSWVEVPVSALPEGVAEGDGLRIVPAAWVSSGAGASGASGHGASVRSAARPEMAGASRPKGDDR